MYVIISPPASKNVFLPRISISSKVSRQSDIKDGHNTAIFFLPSSGNSASLLSVKGVSHPGPNLD